MKMAQCSHEFFVRWLEGDAAIAFTDLRDLTLGHWPQQISSLNEQRRAAVWGRRVHVPAGSAWSTLDDIKARAKARKEAREKT